MIDVAKEDLMLLMEAGYIYMAMTKFSEAKQVFEGVIALAPKSEIPKIALANVLFAQKKYLPAIRLLKDSIKINENSAYAHAYLGESYLFYGKKDLACEHIQKAVDINESPSTTDFAKGLLKLIDMGYDPVKLKKEQAAAKKSK